MEIHEEKAQGEEEQEEAASMRRGKGLGRKINKVRKGSLKEGRQLWLVPEPHHTTPTGETMAICKLKASKGERLRLIENVILCINSAYDIGALVEARASLLPTCCAGAPNFLFSGVPCLDSSSKTTNGLKT
ncbi:hypothetical protein Gotur_008432 [Gossypium turneri]